MRLRIDLAYDGTDFVFGDDNALRYSLLIVTGIALVGAMILLGMGLKHYRGSLDRLQEWKPQGTATPAPA